MLYRSIRRDAMAEIEDQGTGAEFGQNGIYTFVKCSPAGDQSHGIEIALHGTFGLQFPRLRKRNGPVQTKSSHTRLLPITAIMRTGSSRKADDRNLRMDLTDALHDPGNRLHAPFLERPAVEHTRPGIENLDRICSRLNLLQQIFRGKLRKSLKES